MRRLVILVNPPNTPGDGGGSGSGNEHSDWANYPHLGILKLCSLVKAIGTAEPLYFDGTVRDTKDLFAFILDNAREILVVGISALTASYEAGLRIARFVKEVDPLITCVFGNDHFTARTAACLRNRPEIDGGFVGNEVFSGFAALVSDLAHGIRRGDYGGYATTTQITEARPEPVFSGVDYSLIDTLVVHSDSYRRNFQTRISPRIHHLTGRNVVSGVPLEFARGCIKFKRNDACSFCSIQYGGMWRNALEPDKAWSMIQLAADYGHDFLYLTTDELAITFPALLKELAASAPRNPPLMVGYARADGLAVPSVAERFAEIGIRFVMVGFDAASPLSLRVLNKPLVKGISASERMVEQNFRAVDAARNANLWIRAGLVVGHAGIDPELLDVSVESAKSLLDSAADRLFSLDVEVLSPEPGSMDFKMLLDPSFARERCRTLGIDAPNQDWQERMAGKWTQCDVIDREDAMRDYATGFMRGVSLDDLMAARLALREHARALRILVGGPI